MDFYLNASTISNSRTVSVTEHVNVDQDIVANYDAARKELSDFAVTVADQVFEDAVLAALGGQAEYDAFKSNNNVPAPVASPEQPVVDPTVAASQPDSTTQPTASSASDTPTSTTSPNSTSTPTGSTSNSEQTSPAPGASTDTPTDSAAATTSPAGSPADSASVPS